MEIKGKIIQVLPLQQGTSKAGNPWKKQEYVLETQEQYPRKVKFDFFGERADQYPLSIGDSVTVSFDLESREFNGRWYTDVRAWKAEKDSDINAGGSETFQTGNGGGFTSEPAPDAFPAPGNDFGSPFPPGNPATDDLPF